MLPLLAHLTVHQPIHVELIRRDVHPIKVKRMRMRSSLRVEHTRHRAVTTRDEELRNIFVARIEPVNGVQIGLHCGGVRAALKMRCSCVVASLRWREGGPGDEMR